MLPAGNNFATGPETGLAYSFIDNALTWETGTLNLSADEFFASESYNANAPTKADAGQWLVEFLRDNGPMWQADIKADADSEGHAWVTVKRAKQDLCKRITAKKDGFGKGAKWYWKLAEQNGKPKEYPCP